MAVRRGASDADCIAQYEQRFATLAKIAAELNVAPEDVVEPIDEILTASLLKRQIDDIDTWLTAELRAALHRREEDA